MISSGAAAHIAQALRDDVSLRQLLREEFALECKNVPSLGAPKLPLQPIRAQRIHESTRV